MPTRRCPALVLIAAGLAAPAFGQSPPAAPAPVAAPATPPPPACRTPEHRQFDFWVGRWDVYRTGTDTLAGRSLIERLYDGCVIRENWTPVRGPAGGSLNSWIPSERRWRQTWADGGNTYADYSGGLDGEAMVLTAPTRLPDGRDGLYRMRFTREAGGTVRQYGTQSADGGETWQPIYDLTYRPAAE